MLISTPMSSENCYVSGSCQAHSGGYKFSKILILTWKQAFYPWQQTQQILPVVFLENTVSFHSSFEKTPAKYLSPNNSFK